MKSTSEYIELLRSFKERNADKYGITKLGLFGSVARGEHKEDSDVDIYMENAPQGLFAMVHLRDELESFFRLPCGYCSVKGAYESIPS